MEDWWVLRRHDEFFQRAGQSLMQKYLAALYSASARQRPGALRSGAWQQRLRAYPLASHDALRHSAHASALAFRLSTLRSLHSATTQRPSFHRPRIHSGVAALLSQTQTAIASSFSRS
jgi:hypothetical protein